MKLYNEALDHVPYISGQEIALNSGNAPGWLGGNQVYADDLAGRLGAFYSDL